MRSLLRTSLAAALALTCLSALVAASPAAAETTFADPRTPHCESLTGVRQVVVVGEFTPLLTRCSSPTGAPLAVTTLVGEVVPVFGTLYYRADEVGPGYDKLTVHLAGDPTGPSAVILVGLVER
ncbi:hypothetical protein [Herbiconiux flava]|uniref:Uncharacterized protein n=1 Tax=Herbiconiux flava TaxID=881268 RepID=A0A852SMY8_9MICO|nr:hypothetical protein [Herbiconiux flava]NYD70177.1 hypothetical protein [Herbiconiux flava]GLK16930.1 hypothetical protein GCM10017602_14120 [Herbiconiux flava]